MERDRAGFNRRSLLRGVAGASLATGVASLATSDQAQAYAPPGDEARARYRESDHVKAFYRTNAYETKKKS